MFFVFIAGFAGGWYVHNLINPLPYVVEYECQERGWIGAKVECDICTHQWIGVFHESTDVLECPNCRQMVNFEIVETAE